MGILTEGCLWMSEADQSTPSVARPGTWDICPYADVAASDLASRLELTPAYAIPATRIYLTVPLLKRPCVVSRLSILS